MATLKNHLILFDAECPMCKLYTRSFVNMGILDDKGRLAYQELPAQACPMLDRERAVNEIALVNQETGEVTYGVSSLFKVIATAVPLLKPLFEFVPFVWLMSKVYAFISYNRRVIIPGENNSQLEKSEHLVMPQPGFKLKYRIAYLTVAWLIIGYILTAYVKLMTGVLPPGAVYREYLICGGQVFFQGLIIHFVNKDKKWDYLGNMMTISVIGALLLLPGLLVMIWIKSDPLYAVGWFMGVAGIMLLLHIRRSKLLGIGWILTFSWVLYRLLVLLFIFLNQ